MKKLFFFVILLLSPLIVSSFSILDLSTLDSANIKINITNLEDRICVQDGICTLNFLTVKNFSVIGDYVNITVKDYNVTNNLDVQGNITSNEVICDSNGCIGNGAVNGTDIAPSSIWGETATDAVRIGSLTDGSYATNNNDLYVNGIVEIEEYVYAKSNQFYMGTIGATDNILTVYSSSGGYSYTNYKNPSSGTGFKPGANFLYDHAFLGIDRYNADWNLIISDDGHYSRNFDHGQQANPTVFFQSATDPNTDNTQWFSITHNKTDSVLDSGKGNITFKDDVKLEGCLNFNDGTSQCSGSTETNINHTDVILDKTTINDTLYIEKNITSSLTNIDMYFEGNTLVIQRT